MIPPLPLFLTLAIGVRSASGLLTVLSFLTAIVSSPVTNLGKAVPGAEGVYAVVFEEGEKQAGG